MEKKPDFQLAFDLSSGKGVAMDSDQSGEITILSGPTWGKQVDESAIPYVYTDGEVQDYRLDVWGLDRRMALVWGHYHKPAAWWADWGGFIGGPRPAPSATLTVEAILLLKDATGAVHEIGPYPTSAWLNGAMALKDGIEILSGAQGVRFHIQATFHGYSAWDLCAKLTLKPDVVFGCGGLAQAVADRYSLVIPPALTPQEFHLDDG